MGRSYSYSDSFASRQVSAIFSLTFFFFFWGHIFHFWFLSSWDTHTYMHIHLTHTVINIYIYIIYISGTHVWPNTQTDIPVSNISGVWDSSTLSLAQFEIPGYFWPQSNGFTKNHSLIATFPSLRHGNKYAIFSAFANDSLRWPYHPGPSLVNTREYDIKSKAGPKLNIWN